MMRLITSLFLIVILGLSSIKKGVQSFVATPLLLGNNRNGACYAQAPRGKNSNIPTSSRNAAVKHDNCFRTRIRTQCFSRRVSSSCTRIYQLPNDISESQTVITPLADSNTATTDSQGDDGHSSSENGNNISDCSKDSKPSGESSTNIKNGDGNDVKIRPATQYDIPAISALSTETFYGGGQSSSSTPPNLLQKIGLLALDFWDMFTRMNDGYILDGVTLERIVGTTEGTTTTTSATPTTPPPPPTRSISLPCQILVATSPTQNKIVGCAEITLRPAPLTFRQQQLITQALIMGQPPPKPTLRPTITNLCVDSSSRRQGIGTLLINQCEQVASEWHIALEDEKDRLVRATKWILQETIKSEQKRNMEASSTKENTNEDIIDIARNLPSHLQNRNDKYKDWEWLQLAKIDMDDSLSSSSSSDGITAPASTIDSSATAKPPTTVMALNDIVLGVNEENTSAITFYQQNGYHFITEDLPPTTSGGQPQHRPIKLQGVRFNTDGLWLKLESYRKVEMKKSLL